jgi:hypothetical protein
MWQDTVIGMCQLAFVPAMAPTILGPDKPALSTSVGSAVIVTIIATTMATLRLWFATTTAALLVVIWTILALQKLSIDRRAAVATGQGRPPDVQDAAPRGSTTGNRSTPATDQTR